MVLLAEENILLIDGHAMAYRSFYALPALNAPDGTPTNAITGFFNMMLKISREWDVKEIVVLFDAKGPTFRHEAYDDYKKGRTPTPEDFKEQLPILRKMLEAFGSSVAVKEGVEADDVIASTAMQYASKGRDVLALSSDKDLMQMLAKGIKIVKPQKGISSFKVYDRKAFEEEYGFQPEYMPDYLALLGDKVDNIPGVPGVGKKTASRLISEYSTLEEIEKNAEELGKSLSKKIKDNISQAYTSRDLIYLKTDISLCDEEIGTKDPDIKLFSKMCNELGLSQILERTLKFWNIDPAELTGESPDSKDVPGITAEESTLEELCKKMELACLVKVKDEKHKEVNESIIIMDLDGHYWQKDLSSSAVSDALKCLKDRKIITENYKLLASTLNDPVTDPENVWDYTTAHYLLHPDLSPHDLPSIEGRNLSPADLSIKLLESRAAMDEQIENMGMSDLMKNLELPLIPVILEMENYGIGIDTGRFEELGEELHERLGEIVTHIEEEAGASVNLNSPKQVGWLLFEHLGLPARKKTKTGYSTNVQVLEDLSALPEPSGTVPSLILEHREISKMLSGFVQPIIKAVNPETGSIHSRFESATTGTGRLSSRDPNMQNLPAYGTWSRKLKEGFVPHGPGRCFVGADYSQVELRVLAHLSGEEKLIEAFSQDRDIHSETASWVFNIEPELVTQELRRFAKMVNFGLLYGMSSFGLAQRLGIGRVEASGIVEKYFNALPGVRDYMDRTYEEAKERGYTKTLIGRIRPLREVTTVNGRDSGALRRVAINSPIQGTAADIARKAMVDFSLEFSKDTDVNLILQVHDSLICECNVKNREEVEKRLCRVMENVIELEVPLRVESKTGKSLAEV